MDKSIKNGRGCCLLRPGQSLPCPYDSAKSDCAIYKARGVKPEGRTKTGSLPTSRSQKIGGKKCLT